MTQHRQAEIATFLKRMKPGDQMTLQSNEERMMFSKSARLFQIGGVITFRVTTRVNNDGTYTAVALKEGK